MKKLFDMTKKDEESRGREKYLQWKDDEYFKHIKRLLEVTIQ